METIKKNKGFSLRNCQIPVISANEIQVIDTEYYVSIFYGINKIEQHKYAVDLLLNERLKHKGTIHNLIDFKKNTKFSSKKWYVEKGINIYENTYVKDIVFPKFTSSNSLLVKNKKSFERVYWLIVIK